MPDAPGLDTDAARELAGSEGVGLGAGYQATVSLHQTSAGKFVVKNALRTPFYGRLFRRFFGRSGIAREHAAYSRMTGIAGIPKSYGLLGDSRLVLEYVEGTSLRQAEAALQNREQFFTKMLATIDAMHAAGVAHCDLKRKDNTLVGPDETPWLIDFGVAAIYKESDSWIKRRWFQMMKQMDYNAWVKLCFGRFPQNLPESVAVRYHPLLLERVARWIRVPWQKITLRRLRKKWRSAR